MGVIGGIITSTLMKLVLLPAIYPWFDPDTPVGDRGGPSDDEAGDAAWSGDEAR